MQTRSLVLSMGGLLLGLAVPATLWAQEISYKDTGAHTYFFGSKGVVRAGELSRSTVQFGAGLDDYHEAFGLGFALELAGTGPLEPCGAPFGILSVNFPKRFLLGPGRAGRTPVQPFVTGGYSLLFGEVAKSRWNFGGGVLWWLEEDAGIRLELRDFVPITHPHKDHGLQFRLALAFPKEEGNSYLPPEEKQ